MSVLNKIDEDLLNACRKGSLRDVKRLLAAGASVNVNIFDTPLIVAAEYGHFEIVSYLLDNGANINERGDCGYSTQKDN